MTEPSACDVAIIGAGPYGLSLAAHLRSASVETRIFGSPMGTWRSRMPAGMYLKSEGCASSLSDPGRSFTLARSARQSGHPYAAYALPVALDTFVEYGLRFQRALVPDVEDTQVVALETTDGGFRLRLADETSVRARRVIVAVGSTLFEHIPSILKALPPGYVSHSSHHSDLSVFKGRDLTVIGGGQSALESAALLRESGANVRVLVRRPEVVWNQVPSGERRRLARRLRRPMNGLGPGWKQYFYAELPSLFTHLPLRTRTWAVRTALGPAGAWWLRERMNDVPVLTRRVVSSADAVGDSVRLALEPSSTPGGWIETDHVIAATGYRVDLAALPFLDDMLQVRLRRIGNAPALSNTFESSVPGLYFIGQVAAQTFGPVMRFVYGADFTSRRLARHLRSDQPRPRSPAVDHARSSCRG